LNQLDKLNFDQDTLVAFYLGGKVEGMNIEVHDVHFFIGKTLNDFTSQVKKSWVGTQKSLHIDSWLALTHIDGHDIKLTTIPEKQKSKKLFFINLGFYQNNKFGEAHSMHFIAAESKEEAKKIAKGLMREEVETLHTDNIYDIDDCIQIDNVGSSFVNLIQSPHSSTQKPENGWMRLSR